ncbi:ATP-binding protein [Acinetobacter sp. I-MWF]|uniref:ATP-binding protein n=1 Tax=Acinetobacter sp. I-MWF TaxID=2940517 RepID=UPI0021C9076C|nr:ATP-binding protein [Acinetobacter sp. I-MWF]MCT9977284.1 ATP-binding protein [Acinetobacter sp. I-MWF]
MKINRLSIKYHPTGIEIEEVEFDQTLSLLVGISGVGKTTILTAIQNLKSVVNGASINGFEWDIELSNDNNKYHWKGAFEFGEDSLDLIELSRAFNFGSEKKIPEYKIKSEFLIINDNEVISREDDSIIFNGQKTVKLAPTKSAINLLKEEDDILIIFNNFMKITTIDNNDYSKNTFSLINPDFYRYLEDNLDLNKIRSVKNDIQSKLYLCQEIVPEAFNDFISIFKQIFPYVEDLKVETLNLGGKLEEYSQLIIKIKEHGVDHWVSQNSISTGMMKTLIHLAYVFLSPKGTIFLVDEFENGFGVNCINSISDRVLNAGLDYQFIVTSHHPYIINKIPVEKWKIVNRERNVIKTYKAKNYIDNSNHDSFIKLINSNFYMNGIYNLNNDDDWTEEDFE